MIFLALRKYTFDCIFTFINVQEKHTFLCITSSHSKTCFIDTQAYTHNILYNGEIHFIFIICALHLYKLKDEIRIN